MIGGELKFSMSLVDGVSPSAKSASLNLKRLQTELRQSKTRLSEYQGQLTRAKALGDVEGYRKYSALVGEARRNVFDLSQAVEQSGGAMRGASGAAGLMGGAVGIVASAAAVGAAAIYGMISATESLIERAIEATEVNKRLSATFEALGAQGPGSGGKTLAFLNDLSSKLPQSRAQLAEWAKAYEAMGVTDLGELRGQIKATASAQAIMGDEGASAYQHIAERIRVAVEEHKGLKLADKQLKTLYQSGLNVTEVAAAMGLSTQQLAAQLKAGTVDAARFGQVLQNTLISKGQGPLQTMGDEIATLKVKASENIGHLFDDVDTTPLTDGLRSIVDLFGQGTASGKGLKAVMTDALNAIIKGIGRTIWQAEMLFGRLEIWALQSGLTLAKVENAFIRIGNAASAVTKGAVAAGVGMIPGIGAPLAGAIQMSAGASAAKAIAPAHAEGGMVTRPAAGEFLASVEPGEMILPRRITRQIQNEATSPRPEAMAGGDTVNHYHLDGMQLTIQAPQGVTDATAVSATGLSVALERLQLGSGR